MTKIFVYGTLKQGYALNNYLATSKFIRTGVLRGFKMYSNGYFPMIVKSDNENDTIEYLIKIKSGVFK